MRKLLIGLTFAVFTLLLIIPLGRILIGAFEDGAGGFVKALCVQKHCTR